MNYRQDWNRDRRIYPPGWLLWLLLGALALLVHWMR